MTFEEWKSEQYKDQSTEEKMEFVEHLHNFPEYFKKAYEAGAESGYNKAEEDFAVQLEEVVETCNHW